MKPRMLIAATAAMAMALLPPASLAQGRAAKPKAAEAPAAPATDKVTAEFEKFREVLEADNPAELFEMKGEDIWKTKRGPEGKSMADCDLGLGPGVVKGAYVQLPRYFADAGRVMDAERRVVYCMVKYLGYSEADIRKQPFSDENNTPDHVSLLTYVAAQSRGMAVAAPQKHAEERKAYGIGQAIFNYRAGPYDFSCASCHGENGMRIRMQVLPNLTDRKEAIKAFQGWPGYRMTGGFMLTQQWRMNDCFRQQRFPQPRYLSDSISALLTYLTVNANGNMYKGPGIKR